MKRATLPVLADAALMAEPDGTELVAAGRTRAFVSTFDAAEVQPQIDVAARYNVLKSTFPAGNLFFTER